MEREKLKELLINHKRRFLSRSDFIRRDVQDEIKNYISQREIIVITGVRRSGKSTLLRLICDDILTKMDVPETNILYLNFEDERFVSFTVTDFEPLYECFLELENPSGRKYLFLDEIQNIAGWERWLNRLYELEDVKVFVTGSNATMLSSEISTALTGRNRQIVTWPFCFKEFLALKGLEVQARDIYDKEKKVEIKRLFEEYIVLGGFPEVLKVGDVTLLAQYFQDILYRDVIVRYGIKNIRGIKELTLYFAANPATVQSYKNMSKIIGVQSVNTVKSYIEALHSVYLFFFTDLFDYSVKRQIYNPSKVYGIDMAMMDAVSFKFSRNLGRLLENLVFLELKRRKKDIYYWRSPRGREVDFITRKGTRIEEAIQVCLSLADENTKQREVLGLMEAKEILKPGHLMLITREEEETLGDGYEGITVTPLWKWLLQEKKM